MKRIAAMIATAALGVTLLGAPAVTAAPGSEQLKGTWFGTYDGFDGKKKSPGGQQKFVIEKINGGVAQGFWRIKPQGEQKWSKKNTMHLMVYREIDGTSFITGGDNTGVYTGSLSREGEMVLGLVQVSEPFLNLQIVLTKKK